ncbi:zincin-like metallopeptidase domain-containing protein [Mucilaginibacter sp. PAMB04274]|uniref:ArdC family protein n=1 Tax=Mucilaginibacter sp. PAMB04274 TaxID=3138568 RepID=UPI0031F6731F
MSNFKALHEQVAEKLIAALEAGTSPFQKPWTDDHTAGFMTPLNPTTGKNYRGMNALWLAMQDRQDPRWMTLKQASFQKWSVEKGAKATLINFVKTTDLKPLLDEKGEKVLDENGKAKMQTVKLEKPVITNAWVFNGEQIKGIPEWKEAYDAKQAEQQWSPVEKAEQIVSASQAKIKHGGNEAYYHLTKDFIQLPKKEQFDSAAKYYATLLHELGHWTGAETRLNRPMEGKFGSEAYAREELRAEIASLMIGSELNIGHNFGQHAAYVDSWIKILKDEPFELHKASADAQKIFDFVLDIENKRDLKQDVAAKTNDNVLNKGDVISYKEAEYRVLAILKGKTAQMVELNTGNKFKLGPKDGLYTSLVNARNNPIGREVEQMAYYDATKDKVEFAHQMEMAQQEQAPSQGMKR